jgi:hypothetical protein
MVAMKLVNSNAPADIRRAQVRAWAHPVIRHMAAQGYGVDDIMVRLRVQHKLDVDRPFVAALVLRRERLL